MFICGTFLIEPMICPIILMSKVTDKSTFNSRTRTSRTTNLFFLVKPPEREMSSWKAWGHLKPPPASALHPVETQTETLWTFSLVEGKTHTEGAMMLSMLLLSNTVCLRSRRLCGINRGAGLQVCQMFSFAALFQVLLFCWAPWWWSGSVTEPPGLRFPPNSPARASPRPGLWPWADPLRQRPACTHLAGECHSW